MSDPEIRIGSQGDGSQKWNDLLFPTAYFYDGRVPVRNAGPAEIGWLGGVGLLGSVRVIGG